MAPHFIELRDHGLLDEGATVKHIQKVSDRDFEEWKKSQNSKADDLRVLGNYVSTGGKRLLALSDAVDLMRESTLPDWPHIGPRVVKEILRAVVAVPGNMVSYHSEWVRLSGVSEGSSICHEHRHHCEVLRLLVSLDQLDASNLASAEQTVRRLVQLECAIERNPKAPDFSGLGVIANGATGSDGKAHVPVFRQWVSDRQRDRNLVLKQQRLWSEETRESRKNRKGKGKGKDDAAAGAPG